MPPQLTASAPGSFLITKADEDTLPQAMPKRKGSAGRMTAFISGVSYCICSASMILLNKHVLSSFGFPFSNTLLLLQSIVAVIIITITAALRLIRLEPINIEIIKLWFPVNFLFVGMIWTGFISLKYVSVPMVTVLKNITNLFTVLGDMFFFNKHQPLGIWLCLAFMFLAAIASGISDLSFSLPGYLWQLANCILTAAYSLYLRSVMNRIKAVTVSGTLDEVSMVFINNILSIPLLLLLVVTSGEVPGVIYAEQWRLCQFVTAIAMSGTLGLFISYTSLWFLHQTSPTTYSLTGSLNKIPTAAVGHFLFQSTASSITNTLSIAAGLAAGVVFTLTKLRSS